MILKIHCKRGFCAYLFHLFGWAMKKVVCGGGGGFFVFHVLCLVGCLVGCVVVVKETFLFCLKKTSS